MLKKILTVFIAPLLLLVTCYLLLVTLIYAEDEQKTEFEFETSYDVVYDIDAEGITTVTEKITLKNLTSLYYATSFKLTIGATQINDIKASDAGGALDTSSEQKDSKTIINVKFNEQIAGLGKTLPWTLQFKSKDFAEKIGKVWEVRAPKISSSTNLGSYNLTLSIPQNFGEPTLISPAPKSQTISQGKMFLIFTKDQLLKSGVSANFGNLQLFDFDLTYHLENNNLIPVLTNIALPPDTAYQDIIFQRINPIPLNVTLDDDGNYLAWYKLGRGQKVDVNLIGSAKLYTASKVKNPYLDPNLRKKYTASDKYWEKDNPQITTKLEEILGLNPPQTDGEKVRLIYRKVVDLLKYDSVRLKGNIERLGAVTALNNPQSAVCMEFTDLFVALARAAGIPARELDGFAYTANSALRPLSLTKDILHAWPEYFDDNRGWVMVDPTWESTTGGVDYFSKLDLNHFVFAIKGVSSQQPVPAGSYKRSQGDLKYIGEDSKDVKVTLAEQDFLGKPQIDVEMQSSNPILAGFPAKFRAKIINVGNALFPSTNLSVLGKKITILDSQTAQNLGPIPAFGSATFEFNIRTKSLFDSYSDEVNVFVGGQKFAKVVEVKPLVIFQTVPLIGFGLLTMIGVIYLAVLGGLVYRKRFMKNSQK